MKKIPAFFPAFMLLLMPFFSPSAEGFSSVTLPQAALIDKMTAPPPLPLLLAQNVTDDYSEAIIWYRQRAEQGHADGQYYLGLMYAMGKGLPRDYKKAAMWYRKAAEQGYPDAQFDLGRLYAVGEGVEQDLVQAYILITLAARQGHKKALRTKDFMAMQMSPQEMEEAQELLMRLQQKSQEGHD
ncbi:MAG: sel1 repeat family protein [Proteobacteria bacterium]|nr:sel1 repeat family protein [Pseudomonadota bacterium]MBU4294983.1 sel1 repeat family protein [Pseudomonadota bacterium]MCG2746665.1 sel1 repeat family protein [Desulfobulbaceae bacterium]